jgi:hypothetical protein
LTPLVLGPAELRDLAAVRAYAEAYPIPARLIEEAEAEPGEFDPGFSCRVPFGFVVGLTLDEASPGRWARHATVTAAARDRLPSAEAIVPLLGLLGLGDAPLACFVEVEESGGAATLHALQMIDPAREPAPSPRDHGPEDVP